MQRSIRIVALTVFLAVEFMTPISYAFEELSGGNVQEPSIIIELDDSSNSENEKVQENKTESNSGDAFDDLPNSSTLSGESFEEPELSLTGGMTDITEPETNSGSSETFTEIGTGSGESESGEGDNPSTGDNIDLKTEENVPELEGQGSGEFVSEMEGEFSGDNKSELNPEMENEETISPLAMLAMSLGATPSGTEIEYRDNVTTYIDTEGNEFEMGSITITNGTDSITILDRNLGATSTDITSTDSYGYQFQWGNNYGFNSFGTVSISTEQVNKNSIIYNPLQHQYYSNSTFIIGYDNWLNDNNIIDLWGGNEDDYIESLNGDNWKVTNATERQGPCPEGFHIPSYGELLKIKEMAGDAKVIHESLFVPFAGYRYSNDGSFMYQGGRGYLWSSSPCSDNSWIRAWSLEFGDDFFMDDHNRANGFSIRCVYNLYDEPFNTYTVTFDSQGGTEVGSMVVEENSTFEQPTNPTKSGYVFSGWYLSGTDEVWNFDEDVVTGDMTLYAKWLREGEITITYDANGGTFGGNVTKDVIYTKNTSDLYIASENIQAPTKEGKWMFDGWYTDSGCTTERYGVENDTNKESKTVYAKWLLFEDLDLDFGSGERYTIMDRNLGASAVASGIYNTVEINAIGKYYQWGNNYGFPSAGSISTNSTLVDASAYGPGNYYYSSTFITRSSSLYRWDSTDNANLWGGTSSITGDKQGPCPSGYHVPSNTEWQNIYDAFTTWKATNEGKVFCNTITSTSTFKCFAAKLKLPFAGRRYNSDSNVGSQGSNGYYWSSSRSSKDDAYSIHIDSSGVYPQHKSHRANGLFVRCFKDEKYEEKFTVTIGVNNSEYGTVSENSISAVSGDIITINENILTIGSQEVVATSTGDSLDYMYAFSGWNNTCGETVIGDCTITAEFIRQAKSFSFLDKKITFGDVSFTIMDRNLGAQSALSGYGYGSNSNTNNIGFYYQWGNNYGFMNQGTVKTSTQLVDISGQGYGPGKYYSKNTFVIRPKGSSIFRWTKNFDGNLWGGLGETQNNANLDADKQGPCSEGYHVPSIYEWLAAYDLFKDWETTSIGIDYCNSINGGNNIDEQYCFPAMLGLPFGGSRYVTQGNVNNQKINGHYWSSTVDSGDNAYNFYFSDESITSKFSQYNSYGFNVRCFKDSPNLTLTFNTNGGTGVENQTGFKRWNPRNNEPIPERAHSVFSGWYSDEDLTQEFTFSDTTYISEDKALYAKWDCEEYYTGSTDGQSCEPIHDENNNGIADEEEEKITVTIEVNNSEYGTVSSGNVANVLSGTSIATSGNELKIGTQTVIATPTISTNQYSYSFMDWESDCGDVVTGNCTITGNFARTTNKYTITFANYDGTVLQTGLVEYGNMPSYTKATPTKAADNTYTYTFKAWTPTISEVTGDATYTATFDSHYIDYTIKFVDYDGREISTSGYHYGDTVTAPTDPSRVGYAFSGWTPTVTTVSGNQTYTGTYTIDQYSITYVLNGGRNHSSNPSSYTVESGMITLQDPTRERSQFDGWMPSNTIAHGSTGNRVFTANWSCDTGYHTNSGNTACVINEYTVTVNAGEYGTVSTGSVKANHGTSITTSGNELRIGTQIVIATPNTNTAEYSYSFSGWNNTCGETVTGDCTITAEFNRIPKTYTLTINYNYSRGGTVTGSYISGVVYGTTYNVTSPDIQYYTANSGTIAGIMSAQDLTVEVTYTPENDENENGIADELEDKFTVSFVSTGNGTLSGTAIYENILIGLTLSGAGIGIPEIAANQYYEFSGWTPIEPTGELVVTENLTFTGEFKPINDENNNGIADEEETYNLTITYEYSRGGEATGSYETGVVYNRNYSVESPSIEHYIASPLVVSGTMGNTGVIVNVVYSPINDENENGIADELENKFTVQFVAERYGSLSGEKSYSVLSGITISGAGIKIPTPVPSTYYIFSGWDKEIPSGDMVVTGKLVYVAYFKPIHDSNNNGKADENEDFTVTFDSKLGSPVTGQVVHYGAKVTRPGTPTKSGYTFTGWYEDEIYNLLWDFENRTITGNVMLYAKWNDKQITEIRVKTEPTKTGYIEGEVVEMSGLVIEVTYDNGETGTVAYPTSGLTINPEGEITYGTTGIEITYEGKTVDYPVEVATKELEKIEITSAPEKTSYIEGQELNLSGMEITVTYDNGKSEIIAYSGNESLFTINPANGSKLGTGNNKVEISYTTGGITKTATQNITVSDKQITEITVKTEPTKTGYIEGEVVNMSGLVIEVTYDNGEKELVSYSGNENLFEINPTGEIQSGTTGIIITYSGENVVYPVEVLGKTLLSIEITKAPTKTEYIEGQELDISGMEVTAYFDNGKSEVVTGYTTSIVGIVIPIDESFGVTYEYGGVEKRASQGITVVAKVVTDIEITAVPEKINYTEGETLDLSGLVISATYNDGDIREFSYSEYSDVFTVSPEEGTAVSVNDTYVTIRFEGQEVKQPIHVEKESEPSVPTSNYSGGGRRVSPSHDREIGTHGSADNQLGNSEQSESQGNQYSEEMNDAYKFAYKHGITTMDTIEKADMDGYVLRSHLAKMLSQFAVNVMGKTPDLGKTGCEDFADVQQESEELKGYMKTACELGLMGLESDGVTALKNFNPNSYVTRAEFGTTLSRLLYGETNNLLTENDRMQYQRYEKHLLALKQSGIMTEIDERRISIKELRGYVMLMLMRAQNN